MIDHPKVSDILDAKWGRPPAEWRRTGGGWGRSVLTERERGYLEGIKASGTSYGEALVQIVERLSR